MAEEQAKPEKKAEDNVVFIGKKPAMSYVMAAITQFTAGQKEVHIKARGRAISTCVDVAEIIRNKFLPDAKVKDIKIGTEQVTVEGGTTIGVSTMEITLTK
ncbi:MAG: DNA-binding protein Alba [Candidatus Aenigmatarchaeota archaeon]